MNPDSSAAVPGGFSVGERFSPLRTISSLGIEMHGGRVVILIQEGCPVPVERTIVCTTVADRQRAVEVRVVQGAPRAYSAGLIGRFLLAGISDGRRGDPRIAVGLALDGDGLLRAWAEETATGARQDVSFPCAQALGEEMRGEVIAAYFRRFDGERGIRQSRTRAAIQREVEDIRKWAPGAAFRRAENARRGISDCTTALGTLAGELASMRRAAAGPPVAAERADAP